MRKLILLRGIPASGKSTFIRENRLEQYTIDVDRIRLLFGNPKTNSLAEQFISQEHNKKVWGLVYEFLTERMEKGETTIIDATHCENKYIERYRQIACKYGYEIIVVDFKTDILKAFENNKKRKKYQFIPEEVIINMELKLKEQPILKHTTYLTPEEFLDSIHIRPIDVSSYDRVIHIGDIHGCYSVLEDLLKQTGYGVKNNLYIFCGDYLDRGIENNEVIQFLLDNYESTNMIFLEGNHEAHLRRWVNDEVSCSNVFENYTKYEIDSFDKKEVKKFIRILKTYFYYKFNGKEVFVSHGGISTMKDLYFMSATELIKGIGKYDEAPLVANKFEEIHNIYQVHGHRNSLGLDISSESGKSFNLEGKVEFGGYLRTVILDKDKGFTPLEIKNEIVKL